MGNRPLKNARIKSMTGYGQARFAVQSLRGNIEVRSINHRYLDVNVRMPSFMSALEGKIKDVIGKYISRGKLILSVNLISDTFDENVSLDYNKLDKYYRQLNRAVKRYNLKRDWSISDIVRLPNIFKVERKELSSDQIWKVIRPSIELALKKLVMMRNKEGKRLGLDILKRITKIETAIKKLEAEAKTDIPRIKAKIEEKVLELLGDNRINKERLEEEAAMLAQHHDVTEELVRLKSHVAALKKTLHGESEMGKKLDFLMQEVNREANTISSKSVSPLVVADVIAIKAEQDKIREQIQNIE